MKVALIHEWLTGFGGGEKVLEELCELFPAPIYALLKDEKVLKGTFLENKEIHTSFIQSLPFAKKIYRNYLSLFPLAIEQFDLSDKDLIISSSHAVAKGVLTHANQLHICYCFTPMRYAWDLYHFHIQHLKGVKAALARYMLHSLRQWDYASASRVDVFACISKHVARRIKKIYGRDATIIYPPVNTEDFSSSQEKEDYYITYSRLVPYKKIDLIVEAFAHMPEKKLIVIGDGPEMKNIKSKAKSNVEILGYQPLDVIKKLLAKARAFIYAAEEDFGIVMVEAMAAGVPVIALNKGAAQEIVSENVSGLFFNECSVRSLCDAINTFEQNEDHFDADIVKSSAERFNKNRFRTGVSRICLKRQILDQKNESTLLPKKVLCHNSSLYLEVIYESNIRRT